MNVTPSSGSDFLNRLRWVAVPTELTHSTPPYRYPKPPACACCYCSPQLYVHDHPAPPIRPLNNSDFDSCFLVTLSSHASLDLAVLTINWIQPPGASLAREQQAAVPRWQTLWPDHFASLQTASNIQAQFPLLRQAFDIFNVLFFCRSLDCSEIR